MNENQSDVFDLQQEWRQKKDELRKCNEKRLEALKDFARKERLYRTELSKKSLWLHVKGYQGNINNEMIDTDKVAWTALDNIVKGLPLVAKLRMERDIAKAEAESYENLKFELKEEIEHIQKEIESTYKGG